jgi:hypothetical protein
MFKTSRSDKALDSLLRPSSPMEQVVRDKDRRLEMPDAMCFMPESVMLAQNETSRE